MKKSSLIYIILAGVLWGTSGIFVHFMAPLGFSSLHMTFLRACTSCLLFGIYMLLSNIGLFKVKLSELLLYIGSGISFFMTASCYYISMQATSISTAVTLMYTSPVFVMLYSVIFFKEKLTKAKIVALSAMLFGCSLVSGIIGGLKFNLVGILFGLLAGLSYTAYNIFTKIEMRRNCNAIQATFYCFTVAALIGSFTCNVSQFSEIFIASPIAASALSLGIGIFTCISPYFLYTIALKHIPVGTASALSILEPMSATIFSVLLFSEPLDLYSVCGILLILSSVFLLSKADN